MMYITMHVSTFVLVMLVCFVVGACVATGTGNRNEL